MATSRLLARSGGKLATRCCSSRTCMIIAMVRIRLTSTTSMTTMRNAGNRGDSSVVISGYSFRAVQYAGRLSHWTQTCLRVWQLLVDRQDAREPAEGKQGRRSNAQGNSDLSQ